MPASVVIGTQWGDEGKGKVVDLLAADADVVVRFHGGNNAGHTLVVDGEKTVLNLIPAGVLHPGRICMLGPGMVIDHARERLRGAGKIGTTGRGIGPAYEDKVARTGIRVADLFDDEVFREALER